MALRTVVHVVKNIRFATSELMVQNLNKPDDMHTFVDKYRQKLKIIDYSNVSNYVKFHPKTYNKFPTSVLKVLIGESCNVVLAKNISFQIGVYNHILRSYIYNNIDFEENNVLQIMNERKIEYNKETYSLLIGYYCQRGIMHDIENFMQQMQSRGLKLDWIDQSHIMMGYIISGQSEKYKSFIESNCLNQDSLHVMLSEIQGYASIGDIDQVLNRLDKLKDENLKKFQKLYLNIYCRLVKGKASKSDLDKILNFITATECVDKICDTIFYLNRNDLHMNSLDLVEKFKEVLKDYYVTSQLITSFNSTDCPQNIYKSLVKLLIYDLDPRLQDDIFSSLAFEEALEFSQSIIDMKNARIVYSSLLNNAISTKSFYAIETSLEFGLDNVKLSKLNLITLLMFIPSMIGSGVVSNCKELLDFLPQYRSVILPAILMHNLITGNFTEFNNMLEYTEDFTSIFYFMYSKPIAIEIVNNLSYQEIIRFSAEASKTFSYIIVNNLLASVVLERIYVMSKKRDSDSIMQMVQFAEDFDVTFNLVELSNLEKRAFENIELFKSLYNRVGAPKSPTTKIQEPINIQNGAYELK